VGILNSHKRCNLYCKTEKQENKGKKLHCAFIDHENAFDTLHQRSVPSPLTFVIVMGVISRKLQEDLP